MSLHGLSGVWAHHGFSLFRVEESAWVDLVTLQASKHTRQKRLDYRFPFHSLSRSPPQLTLVICISSLFLSLHSGCVQGVGLELQLVRSLAVSQAEAGSQIAGKEFLVLDGGE